MYDLYSRSLVFAFGDEKKSINPTIELIAFALEKVTNEMKDLELVCSFKHLIEGNSGIAS